MDLFEVPQDHKPERQISDQEMDDITNYLKDHPLFMKQLPSNIEDNQHLLALQSLKQDESLQQIAQNLNSQANSKLNQKPCTLYHMKDAYSKYTEAINLKCLAPKINAKLHCNRAAINMKLKNYGKVIEDCKACLKFDPEYLKGYYRYGQALLNVDRFEECMKLLESRNEEELQPLMEEAKKKLALNAQKKQVKAQRNQKNNRQIEEYCSRRKWKLAKKKASLPENAKMRLQDGKLTIPIVVAYPEFGFFDLVAAATEKDKVFEHVNKIAAQGIPWDQKGQYSVESIEVYCEVSDGVALKIPRQARVEEVAERVPLPEALEVQVLSTNSVFYKHYISTHKIL